ncbi:uncharacterized protein LOC143257436 isoform X2 [Tachypleus tridentatus]|uniref:uncharacterized protein LOC143257436 isoform X2 n=1 Tax=Tachypleus tridentatus TaxID=6853 RepID=UPI003FD0CD66
MASLLLVIQIPEGRIQVLKTDRNMNYQGSSRTSSTCLISEYNYSQCLTEIEKELTKLEDFITKKLVECTLLQIELVVNITPPEFIDDHQMPQLEPNSVKQIKETEDEIKCHIPTDIDSKS